MIPKWWLEFWFLLLGRKSDFCNSVYIYDSNNHSAQQCRTKKKILDILHAVLEHMQSDKKLSMNLNFESSWSIIKRSFFKTEKKEDSFFFLHLSVIFLKEIWCLFFLFNSVASVLPDVDFFPWKIMHQCILKKSY